MPKHGQAPEQWRDSPQACIALQVKADRYDKAQSAAEMEAECVRHIWDKRRNSAQLNAVRQILFPACSGDRYLTSDNVGSLPVKDVAKKSHEEA